MNFLNVAVAVPNLKVSDCIYNTQEMVRIIGKAEQESVKVLLFPELSITAYTCGDLFFQNSLLKSAEEHLKLLLEETKEKEMLIVVGLPVGLDNQLFNCMALMQKGKLLGLVPKTFIPNYKEFYEERWFASATDLISNEINFAGQSVPIGADLIFCDERNPLLKIGIEVCEDLWATIPPSSNLALQGATLILNGSASNELVSKAEYRKELVLQQSARCLAGYAYASAGIYESTQDTIFSGHSLICENGILLGEMQPFHKEEWKMVHLDLEVLAHERRKQSTFMHGAKAIKSEKYREISFSFDWEKMEITTLKRPLSKKPFTPENPHTLEERCKRIFEIQSIALARRFTHTHSKTLVIGISGGLDSTLALLVAVKACQYLEVSPSHVLGITMPGFGTTDRTYQNALRLMELLGIETREISIQKAVIQHFEDIGHDGKTHDITYENSQARERTQILMDIANQTGGIVVGTGDLSELALGFATYNGDHMSMYGVNAGVPKTLVRVLVNWIAQTKEFSEEASAILLDVLDTPVSPELLPPDEKGDIHQKTEDFVGPYELHDFFLFQILRFGFSPKKVLFLAEQSFEEEYTREVLLKWLKNFYRRFFAQQFKRSCLPDGVKIGALCLSPRADWRMPTDASYGIWQKELEEL